VNRICLSVALFLSALDLPAFAQSKPSLTMTCINPPNQIKFTSIQGTQASTEPVQFNVNIPAGQGTIFVDKNNSGMCTATISDGFQFVSGHGEIDPSQVSVSNPHTASDLMSAVKVTPTILGNQKILFEISRSNDAIKGNLNIHFITKYKID
jgi:hypothetical protein